ncbi:hypothetical protein RF11_15700 [Thelohanellus kitauei]|uniref:CCHC-type domain-containing protein n=1 Tax=Thelohanellus kitauei TaxID=669202 RepID=A0A0C2JKI9_THEKT|nr:hypothetical protein RF11_14027 [Thelohanellus kitauei]KII69918.1 hypothetical protein RF11_15700 [Thelohanellus kitauei]
MSNKSDLQLAWSGRNISKIPPFSGKCFTAWLKKFELACRMDGIKGEDRKDTLLIALELEVHNEVTSLKWDQCKYEDLVKNLEARFLPVDDKRLRSAQLLEVRKLPSQTFREYASSIIQLASVAMASEPDPAFLISIFTNGLEDESLKSVIETHDVQTLWDAAKLCEKHEHRSRQRVCAANISTDRLSIVERKLDELATQMANVGFNKSSNVCFGCGRRGHLARNCRFSNRRFDRQFATTDKYGRSANYRRNPTTIRGRINGVDSECLIDTGSEISLLKSYNGTDDLSYQDTNEGRDGKKQ